MRRDSGLDVSDRIRLGMAVEAGRLAEAVDRHRDYIAGETLAVVVMTDAEQGGALDYTARVEIEGESITLGLSRSDG